ncbi:MAG: hypothetical protein Q7W13_16510 [Bacteroidia bacterium]|jgi:hypothetical protein|nr:hypothetical protein [Bacteroidia bacterium]
MRTIKRYLGIFWLLLGLGVGYFNVIEFGLPKLQSGKQEDLVFGIINLFILTPIIVGGLVTFGYYVLSGEYDEKTK